MRVAAVERRLEPLTPEVEAVGDPILAVFMAQPSVMVCRHVRDGLMPAYVCAGHPAAGLLCTDCFCAHRVQTGEHPATCRGCGASVELQGATFGIHGLKLAHPDGWTGSVMELGAWAILAVIGLCACGEVYP
jgi:hypothetical protein